MEELSKGAGIDSHTLQQQIKTSPTSSAMMAKPIAISTKMPTALRLSLMLVIQYPSLALTVDKLPNHIFPEFVLLEQLIALIKTKPQLTTGTLLEYWRGQKEEPLISELAKCEHIIPDKGVKSEFLGAIRQLTVLECENEINRLLAKNAHHELSIAEKNELTRWMEKKRESSANPTNEPINA